MAEHTWDLRRSADQMRWRFWAVCGCGWKGTVFRQEMRGRSLEPRRVSMELAAADGLAHCQGARLAL
jgi:hypothetical protein